MKFVLVGFLAVLFCYQCSSTEAAGIGWRNKRSVDYERCPANSTEQECIGYAREKLVKRELCTTFTVTTDKYIEWQLCETPMCYASGQEIPTKQDLTKPYPGCCPKFDLTNITISSSGEGIICVI